MVWSGNGIARIKIKRSWPFFFFFIPFLQVCFHMKAKLDVRVFQVNWKCLFFSTQSQNSMSLNNKKTFEGASDPQQSVGLPHPRFPSVLFVKTLMTMTLSMMIIMMFELRFIEDIYHSLTYRCQTQYSCRFLNVNKKFEVMLTKRAKAYSSSSSQTVRLSPAVSSQFIFGMCAT